MLEFRGIEVTAENFRHLRAHGVERLSDLALTAESMFGVGGYKRAAGYLLDVPQDVRNDVESDGTIQANVCGHRYADGVQMAVARYLAGDASFRYVTANREMLARERAARERTGRFVPESMDRAFAGLMER